MFASSITHHSRRGVSLLEGVAALVVSLAVLSAGVTFFEEASTARKIAETARSVNHIVAESRHLFGSDTDAAFMEDYLIDAQVVPRDNILDGVYPAGYPESPMGLKMDDAPSYSSEREGKIVHAWGNIVEVYAGSGWMSVRMAEIPGEACIRYLSVDEKGSGALGFGALAFNVDGTLVTSDAFPITPDVASDICGSDPEFVEIGFQMNVYAPVTLTFTCENGKANPGNDKCVGNAGETPDGSDDWGSGSKGKSDAGDADDVEEDLAEEEDASSGNGNGTGSNNGTGGGSSGNNGNGKGNSGKGA